MGVESGKMKGDEDRKPYRFSLTFPHPWYRRLWCWMTGKPQRKEYVFDMTEPQTIMLWNQD